jgi:hypothetical protein
MTARIDSLIATFDGSTSLAQHVLKEITRETLFSFLGTRHRAIKARVTALLKEHLHCQNFRDEIVLNLRNGENVAELLTELACTSLNNDSQLLSSVRQCLASQQEDIRAAAARVIVYQYPAEVECLVRLLANHGSMQIAKILCHSRNSDLILPVHEFLKKYHIGAKHRSPVLGLLLNPYWLAENFNTQPNLVRELAFEYGYSQSQDVEPLIPLFERGFYFANGEMATRSVADKLQHRVHELARALLPDYLRANHPDSPSLAMDTIDLSLLIAAAREQDVVNLEQRKGENPYGWHQRENVAVASLYHASYEYCKRRLIDEPIRLAQELNVETRSVGQFLIEHARIVLETDLERKVEADLIFRSKWIAISRVPTSSRVSTQFKHPVLSDADFPLLKFAVLRPNLNKKQISHLLSAGAAACVNLCEYLGLDIDSDELLKVEQAYTAFLLPIGCEAQITNVPRNTAMGWKQALRHFGIPSPRRLEYKNMVEASFRPSLTFHAQVLSPALLLHLGLISSEEDIAFHLSVAGALGHDSKYLVFPIMFQKHQQQQRLSPGTRQELRARHMSKGFVCFNKDAEQCGNETFSGRTELRIMRLEPGRVNQQLQLNPRYIENLIALHLLASALVSQNADFHDVFQAYKAELTEYIATLPREFSDLLEGNYFDATGDPQDGSFVAMLPIIQKIDAVWHSVSCLAGKENPDAFLTRLDNELSELLWRNARAAFDVLQGISNCNPAPDTWPKTRLGIPYCFPRQLLS